MTDDTTCGNCVNFRKADNAPSSHGEFVVGKDCELFKCDGFAPGAIVYSYYKMPCENFTPREKIKHRKEARK